LAYFEDLSVYSYRDEPDVVSPADRVDRSSPPYLRVDATMARVNIGWLGGRGRFGRRARFATGPVADGAVDALLDVIEALLAFRHGTTDLAQGWFTSLFGANPPPDLRAESPAP